jgi:hypothetical protein
MRRSQQAVTTTLNGTAIPRFAADYDRWSIQVGSGPTLTRGQALNRLDRLAGRICQHKKLAGVAAAGGSWRPITTGRHKGRNQLAFDTPLLSSLGNADKDMLNVR